MSAGEQKNGKGLVGHLLAMVIYLTACATWWCAESVAGQAAEGVAKPILTESSAVEQAAKIVGVDAASVVNWADKKTLTKPPEIPFLYKELQGKEVWSVALGGVGLTLLSASGEVKEHGMRDFRVLLDSSNGKVLSITSTSNIEVPGLRPRPSVEWAEKSLADSSERYEGFPEESPGVTFLEALDIVWHHGQGNPLRAKDIDAAYVIHSDLTKGLRPVWVITLRGVGPMLFHGGGQPPIWMGNCIRHVVDARTGRFLFSTNYPTPRPVEAAVIQGEEQEPVISYFTVSKTSPEQTHRVKAVVVFWKDGRIIWSEDRVRGGPPYLEAYIDKRSFTDLLEGLEQVDLFNRSDLNRTYSGSGAEASKIVIADGSRLLSMMSWHELAELDPGIVATSERLLPLNGKTREEVLAEDKNENYLPFRAAWDEVRQALLGLIPATSGTPLGEVEFEMRWVTVDKRER